MIFVITYLNEICKIITFILKFIFICDNNMMLRSKKIQFFPLLIFLFFLFYFLKIIILMFFILIFLFFLRLYI